MSVATSRRYRRPATLLWRDTGRHVVVLPAERGDEAVVLGGGSAAVWRALATSASVTEIIARFDDPDNAPTTDELVTCLEDLAGRDLVVMDAP